MHPPMPGWCGAILMAAIVSTEHSSKGERLGMERTRGLIMATLREPPLTSSVQHNADDVGFGVAR